MKKIYIKPDTEVLLSISLSLLSGSEDRGMGHGNAKQWNPTYAESYDDSEEADDNGWPKSKSLWDE